MLVETANEVLEHGGDTRALRFYGQEVNLTTAAIARMNLFLHDIEDFVIVRGDTLRDPEFLDARGRLQRFDVVIANPPFSLKNWGARRLGRRPVAPICGVPPASNGDFAWVQHMVASMKPDTGRVGVVMPHGVLFRGGAEGAIRECLIEQDRLEAVIGLPPNLFYSTTHPGLPAHLPRHQGQRNAPGTSCSWTAQRFTKGRNQNTDERRRRRPRSSRRTGPGRTPTATAASRSGSSRSTRSRPTAGTSTSAATSRPPPADQIDLDTALAAYRGSPRSPHGQRDSHVRTGSPPQASPTSGIGDE